MSHERAGRGAAIRRTADLRGQRRSAAHRCWDHLILAPLWPLVEIPMIGTGLSLNVAVAGSLVAYKLAGML